MKKLALIITVMFVMATLFSTLSFAVELPLRVVVNGDELRFPDAQPFVDGNGRTQTPARFIGEALGATVTWDGSKQKAVFELCGNTLVLYIGKKDYDLNGQKKQMDTAAMIRDGRTFVPARYVAEAFGATVKWDSAIRTVYIKVEKTIGDKTGTKVIAGFEVPKDTDLSVFVPSNKSVEIQLSVDLLTPNVEKQISDMAGVLSQKCDQTTVEQVVSYVKQKKVRRDYLPEKYIYDSRSQRCVWIKESQEEDINICYLTSEDSKPYKN